MLTTALLVLLASADVQPAFLSGTPPRAVRLLASDEPPPAGLSEYDGWSKAQLRQEHQRLSELRPGVGLPIALMASGGGALTVSLYILIAALSSSGTGSFGPLLAFFGIVATSGAAMVIIGVIALTRVMPDRREFGTKLDAIDRQMKGMDDDYLPDDRRYVPAAPPPIIGPPPEGPPPPPLPPFSPQASVQLPLFFARF